jgi:hypothetical protein
MPNRVRLSVDAEIIRVGVVAICGLLAMALMILVV